jgi:hypothetical protein
MHYDIYTDGRGFDDSSCTALVCDTAQPRLRLWLPKSFKNTSIFLPREVLFACAKMGRVK